MKSSTRTIGFGAAAVTTFAGVAFGVLALTPDAGADQPVGWTSIPANSDVRGVAVPNGLPPELRAFIAAQGSQQLENPSGLIAYYGYLNDGTLVPDPSLTQSPTQNVEASKTEPDKNTYLRLRGLHGADPNYRYGTHFLFQGHEGAKAGYVTRVNLDADPAHRVTLLATTMVDGTPIPAIDGSTWDPFADRLLLTSENGNKGAVLQATPDINASVQDISSVFGRAGYEGIQNDADGNLWIVEDTGGASPTGSKARNPNSFVYRLIPNDKRNLAKGGKLQALQALSARTHTPITFQAIDAAHPTGGIFTDDQKDISSYGIDFDTRWVTVHDTNVDHSGLPFDANALAKAAGATPLKRPENGVFRPGTGFREFFFETTGDTNAASDANAEFGGWGGAYQLVQNGPSAERGKLRLFFKGDQAHTGMDNVTFIDRDHVAYVEDAGSTLHVQRNALDSAYLFDVRADYSHGRMPTRFIAEGRDEAATLDAMLLAAGNGFNNDDDNEITGIHMSDGDPTPDGILGARVPKPFRDGWRLFWTQQHGQNVTWELTSN